MKTEPFVQVPISWLGALSPNEVVVGMVIAHHANDTGEAWPSLRTIARMTGLARNTVRQCITRLEDAGVLQACRGRHRPQGGDTSHLYRIRLPKQARAAGHQSRPGHGAGRSTGSDGGAGDDPGQQRTPPQVNDRPGPGQPLTSPRGNDRPDPGSVADPQEPYAEEQQPDEPQAGNLCVSRAHVQARAGAADAAAHRQRSPRGDGYVLRVPPDLQWAQVGIEAFWAAKKGPRHHAAAEHLWEQLRAIAAADPQAVLEQLRRGAANGWGSIDATAWRRYTRHRSGTEEKSLAERIREGAAAIEASLNRQNLNTIPEDHPAWH